MMVGTFLAITRQPLARCSNHYGFGILVSIEKKLFDLGLEFSGGDVTSRGVSRFFAQLYLALGANPMSHFGFKFFGNLGYHPSL